MAKIDPEERERRREVRRRFEAMIERLEARQDQRRIHEEHRRQRLQRLTFGLFGR